jgi:DNA-binding beta-propeller fold protein YncE
VFAVATLLAALALLVLCVPALALSQQGHEYETSFGSKGHGEGQFSNPAGVAVNEGSGDVYVVDRGNNRVERFSATGAFIEAWGYGVKDGEKTYETCKAGEGCGAGTPGKGKGREAFSIGTKQFISPEGIAIDNTHGPSSGDVYVVADVVPEKAYVEKFTATGEFLSRITKTAETESDGRPEGVAVDASGQLWVAWSGGEISDFNDALVNRRVGETGYAVEGQDEELVRPGLAVDARDHLFLDFEPNDAFAEAGDEESPFSEENRGENGELPCELAPCVTAELVPGAEEGELPADLGEQYADGLFGEDSTGLAADLADNDLYVDHQKSVSEYSAAGDLVQSFGAGHLTSGTGVAVDGKTGVVYAADAASSAVEVFSPQAPTAPSIEDISATEIAISTAQLSASVNSSGASTTVSFRYGAAACAEGGCTEVPATPATLANGFEAQGVSVALSELAPGTTYHYQVIARGLSTTTSPEATFTTRPVQLADDRSWEMVSPPRKNGVGIESLTQEGGVIQASALGDKLTYVTTGPSEQSAEGNRSPAFTQDYAERVDNAQGLPEWVSKEIAIPNPERAPGISPGQQQEYLFFSSDLSLSLVEPFGSYPLSEPKLSPEASEKTIYVRHDEGCLSAPSSCSYTPLVTAANDTAEVEGAKTRFGGIEGRPRTGVHFRGATSEMSHVVLSAEVPLTGEATSTLGEPLYEWTGGEPLKLVNILPGNSTPPVEASLGQSDLLARDAISEDGSRIVWEGVPSGKAGGQKHLYTRDMLTGTTTQVDAPEAGAVLEASENPIFQAASADGTKIFFTDEQHLTTAATSAGLVPYVQRDLYELDVLTGKLTDLTPLAGHEAAAVLGLLPGTSEDGTTVYFVANGVLTTTPNQEGEAASPGHCAEEEKLPGASCNLYVEHFDSATQTWEAPTFIGRLSGADSPDWGEVSRLDLGEVTDRVSPDGNYFAFMSQRPLTKYDNHDSNPESGGARAVEVYLFNRGSGALTCVSCEPTGAPPHGVLDTEESGEGLGLLVDRIEAWKGHWLAGSIPGWTQSSGQQAFVQSRYLSDTGRLFFDSPEPLVPAAENAKEDVYEYEQQGEGTCASANGCIALISSGTSSQESAFIEASKSGNDAFFVTASPLVAADTDTNFDVYDARVCSESSPCVQSQASTRTPCEAEASCKAPSAGEPVYAPALSSTVAASGNVTQVVVQQPPKNSTPVKKLTRAQELAKALKACKRLKKKGKRIACEKSAHKKYPTKKARKSSRKSA